MGRNDGLLVVENGAIREEKNAFKERFRLFSSVSKPTVALGIFILIQDQLLHFETTLEDVGFTDAKEVTVRQLLDHTSGLVDVVSKLYFERKYCFRALCVRNDKTELVGSNRLLEYIASQGDEGVRRYNNFGYDLLGMVIERVTGVPASEFVRKRIFVPLGMHHTGFQHEGHKNEQTPLTFQNTPGIKEQQNAHCGNGFVSGSLYDAYLFVSNHLTLLAPEMKKRFKQMYFYDGDVMIHTGSGDFSRAHIHKQRYRPLSKSFVYSNGTTVIVAATSQSSRSFLHTPEGTSFRKHVYAMFGRSSPF